MRVSILLVLSTLFITTFAFATPPSTHTTVNQPQTMKDLRWSMSIHSQDGAVDFTDSNYQVIAGPDALNEIQNVYGSTSFWEAPMVRYVRGLLANPASKAVVVHSSNYYLSILVPWNASQMPSMDVPLPNALVTDRAYLLVIDPAFVDYLGARWGFDPYAPLPNGDDPKQGEAGTKGADPSCGCVDNLANQTCSNCVSPPYSFVGNYPGENNTLSSYDNGQLIPVYGQ